MPHSSGGGSHSGGYRSSSSGSSRSYSSSGGGSHSSGYSYSSGSSRSYSNSGGGSHSGGYRNSSSGSSRSYSSSRSTGSRSSYSSSGSRAKIRRTAPAKVSKTYFKGARKYVTYKNSQPNYYYSDYETVRVKKRRRLIIWIPLVLLFAFGLYAAIQPDALTTDYNTEIRIQDTLGLIDDTQSLSEALTRFRNTTGITPYVTTVSNESWNAYYENLYNLAFDIYMNNFEDEKHWVIAYSEPESPDPGFNDWYWEGVQGDDTVHILTEQAADRFGITLQKYLTNQQYSVAEAITMAFNEITPEIMNNATIDFNEVFSAIIIMGIILWIAIKRTGIFTKAPERPKTIPAEATAVNRYAKEITCEYCDRVYLSDSLNCPYCGAGRQAIN